MLFAKFGYNWPSGSVEEDFFLIFASLELSPLGKRVALHWINLYTLHPRMFGCNWPSGSGEHDFKICQCIFTFSKLSPFGKGRKPLLEQTWIPLTKRWFVPNLVDIGPLVMENTFLKTVNVCSYICNYLPLEKGGDLHLNKLKSPSPKDDLCQAWLKLAQWFLKWWLLKFVNVFSLFRNYLPLKKGTGPFILNKLALSSPKDALCQVWLKLTQWF